MVETTLVEEQLKRIKFNTQAWNRAETQELATIILPKEEIYECANGWYEGGFALIVATNIRVLLIDKKPFKYLAVEDLRFDMINEIDYSHRMFDARINISTGAKVLSFRSYNQQRLRKLITHIQHRMAEIKHEQVAHNDQQQEHLKQIDQKLHDYLITQFQQYQMQAQGPPKPQVSTVAAVKPFTPEEIQATKNMLVWDGKTFDRTYRSSTNGITAAQLYEDGHKEVFSKHRWGKQNAAAGASPTIFRHRQFGRTILQNLLIHHPNPGLAY